MPFLLPPHDFHAARLDSRLGWVDSTPDAVCIMHTVEAGFCTGAMPFQKFDFSEKSNFLMKNFCVSAPAL
jgi:hypothetical protein